VERLVVSTATARCFNNFLDDARTLLCLELIPRRELGDRQADQIGVLRDLTYELQCRLDRHLALGIGDIRKFFWIQHIEIEVNVRGTR
jgi:hypothetical protein